MINWGMGGPQNNALAYFQMGNQLGSQVRERQDQAATRKALGSALGYLGGSGIAADPKADEAQFNEVIRPLDEINPELAFKVRRMRRDEIEGRNNADLKRAEQRRADLPMITNLLETSTDQASYDRNRATAQQYGIDVSQLPQAFDPAWRDQQIATMKALQDPAKVEALSTAGKIAVDQGFKPGTPQFNQRVTEIWTASEAKPYVVGGETRLYTPKLGGAGQVQGQARIIPQKPQGMTDDEIWKQAHEAVRNGANADEVFRQLQAWGMQP